ncbi:hypothetical protein ACMHYJ_16075 [Castellaniella hirudinis]|uniref:hypothetical protein n=1 Tax=Castellaniella hirudinis TaxID=1144617 RepID=UPI0039C47365
MAYEFHANGEIYIGRTTPGAARMRIFESKTNRLIVAFDPDTYTLRSHHPCGSWSNIQPDTDLALLQTLQPQILSACQDRLRFHDTVM